MAPSPIAFREKKNKLDTRGLMDFVGRDKHPSQDSDYLVATAGLRRGTLYALDVCPCIIS